MLLAEPIAFQNQPQKQERYLCLDLLNATFECAPPVNDDSAILVEVWPQGGLLHVDRAVPVGCEMTLEGSAVRVRAKAVSCSKDDRGYVVEIAVEADQPWFPANYFPPYLLPAPASAE